MTIALIIAAGLMAVVTGQSLAEVFDRKYALSERIFDLALKGYVFGVLFALVATR